MISIKFLARLIASMTAAAALAFSPAAFADSGPFIGVSVGNATVSADIPDPVDPGFNDINFDDSDFAWKVHGGYAFDLPLLDLGVELAYFDLGSPTMDIADQKLGIDVTGIAAYGLAGLNIGPVGVFLKYGFAQWDAKLALAGLSASEDGSDPAYGAGLRLTFGSLEVRGEYEVIDIEDTDDVYMASLGLVWRF
ncbi:MAG: outer membrane beta-barrel protein [Woeseiaceae bacterium]